MKKCKRFLIAFVAAFVRGEGLKNPTGEYSIGGDFPAAGRKGGGVGVTILLVNIAVSWGLPSLLSPEREYVTGDPPGTRVPFSSTLQRKLPFFL